MANIKLSDITTLKDLLSEAEKWDNLPSVTLSEQQLALIQLRRAYLKTQEKNTLKGGGHLGNPDFQCCFICASGA